MKKFGLIGASGYIAPRHMAAIQATRNELVAAVDTHDCVGIMDRYFPNADFFTEFERFDRHIDKCRRAGNALDYVSICTPNYLHDAHVRFGLRNKADVICEKPLVLNPWNIDGLRELEEESGKKVYSILQLRLHPVILALREKVQNGTYPQKAEIDLTYITSRGKWYYAAWKGNSDKSGGIATNIGIHFFDMLMWIFGAVKENIVHQHTHDRASGYLELENAHIRWFVSINSDLLPEKSITQTHRQIVVNGEEIEFSNGFTDLHTLSYQEILNGNGFGLSDALPSIQLAHDIRNAPIQSLTGAYHPLAKKPLTKHPFH